MLQRLASATVREARESDVAETVRLRAESWRTAYAGIMPPAYLDAIDTGPETIARGVRHLRDNPPDRHELVAERHGRVVAFCMCGPERPNPRVAPEAAPRGEVYALYAHPDSWSTGVGGQLLAAARAALAADGLAESVVWVLERNARARAFYERHGLRPTGERAELRLGGVVLQELLYGSGPVLVGPRPARPSEAHPAPAATPARRGG
jgi:ribosomal protein S18 acetylase RimI-like enzyme